MHRSPYCSRTWLTALLAGLLVLPHFARAVDTDPVASVEVLTDHPLGEIYDFWSIRNFIVQDLFADPAERAEIAANHAFMRDVNAVRLMGGREDGLNEFYKGVDEQGKVIADFAPLIRYVGGILEGGYTPRIVLDNVPNGMTADLQFHLYGNTSPPDDFDVYHEYVRMFTQALVDAFGYREVSAWRFRVGTEPDLFPGHWRGSKEEYLKMYDYAVHAVTEVIPEADIGPGNILTPIDFSATRDRWGLDIIDHAGSGTNYYTGATGTRMRHFSLSWYDRVGEEGGLTSLQHSVKAIRQRLKQFPQFEGIPVEVAEFMILHDEDRNRYYGGDVSEWQASWFAAVAQTVYDLDIPQVHLWDTTTFGVWHPKTHVIAFLDKMAGGRRVESIVRTRRLRSLGALAATKNESIYVIIYNHDRRRAVDAVHKVNVIVRDPRLQDQHEWVLDQWQVDKERGVYVHQFIKDLRENGIDLLEGAGRFEGAPQRLGGEAAVELFKANRGAYEALANDTEICTGQPVSAADGKLEIEVDLPVHAVRMLRFTPVNPGRL